MAYFINDKGDYYLELNPTTYLNACNGDILFQFSSTPSTDYFLLQENGDFILQENGDKLIL